MKRHILLIPALALFSQFTLSQTTEVRIRAAMDQSSVSINGKEQPDRIPYSVRMQVFFQRYQALDLSKELALDARDAAMLTGFAEGLESFNQRIQEDHDRSYLKIADKAEGMEAVEIAREMMSLRSATEARLAKQYRIVLAKLSPTGLKAVESYIADHVRPSIVTNDETILAQQAPDFYKEQVIATREYVRTGNWPVDAASDARSTKPTRSNQAATSAGAARVGTN